VSSIPMVKKKGGVKVRGEGVKVKRKEKRGKS
jgi:hypothetical protein